MTTQKQKSEMHEFLRSHIVVCSCGFKSKEQEQAIREKVATKIEEHIREM